MGANIGPNFQPTQKVFRLGSQICPQLYPAGFNLATTAHFRLTSQAKLISIILIAAAAADICSQQLRGLSWQANLQVTSAAGLQDVEVNFVFQA